MGDSGPPDTTGDVSAPSDSGTPEAAPDAANDSAASDSAIEAEAATSCLQLAAPTQISTDNDVDCITTDGYVISGAADGGTDDTPLAGGSTGATGIPAGDGFGMAGPVYTTFLNDGNLIATWQAGLESTGTPIPAQQMTVSSDGLYMVSAGGDGSVTFSKTDMTGQVQLVSAPDGGTQGCPATVGFAGNYVVVATFSCTAPDAGNLPLAATITSYAVPSLTPATILANAQIFWSADAAGTKVFAITTGGAASVFPIAGGAGTAIDTNVWSGFMTPDGTGVVYATTSGQLKRAATANPQPTVLVPSGVYDFASAYSWENATSVWLPSQSADGSQIITCGGQYCQTGDVSFASTTTAGTKTTIAASGPFNVFHDPFTHDGTYTLVRTKGSGLFGAANLVATKAGGAAKTIAMASSRHFATSSGAKVVYDDNFANGTSDLYVVDLASPCQSPTLIASGIRGFWVNHARDTIVYAKNAIYKVPVP